MVGVEYKVPNCCFCNARFKTWDSQQKHARNCSPRRMMLVPEEDNTRYISRDLERLMRQRPHSRGPDFDE